MEAVFIVLGVVGWLVLFTLALALASANSSRPPLLRRRARPVSHVRLVRDEKDAAA